VRGAEVPSTAISCDTNLGTHFYLLRSADSEIKSEALSVLILHTSEHSGCIVGIRKLDFHPPALCFGSELHSISAVCSVRLFSRITSKFTVLQRNRDKLEPFNKVNVQQGEVIWENT
jgi:hypothetical protein